MTIDQKAKLYDLFWSEGYIYYLKNKKNVQIIQIGEFTAIYLPEINIWEEVDKKKNKE